MDWNAKRKKGHWEKEKGRKKKVKDKGSEN